MNIFHKKVLITGASTGIGKAIAQYFIQKGAKVIVCGIHKPDLEVLFHKVDITQETEITSALLKVGAIDVLILNSGIVHISTLLKTSNDSFNDIFNTNVRGLFWMAKHAVPLMTKGGCILTISSIAGLKSYEGYGIYCATKAAIISLTQTFALELADKKIRANCIAPGIVTTPIWNKMYGKHGTTKLKEEAKSVLMKRAGTPEEIAHAALFACENDFVNGAVIVVDGGETAA